MKYVAWKESFTNWLTYGNYKYSELLKDVEALDEPCKLSDFASEEVKEMAKKLYAILASYIKGPASQIVRAADGERNGFLVWQQLRDLYIPRARPRTMAIGQAIMSYPPFQQSKSMLENLLQLDLLLDQYQLASGHSMPEDLAVATVLRCVAPSVRQHLELTLDDKIDYYSLKERLILMDKNSKTWTRGVG